ncbi:hypothetical protein PflQ2_5347 [Pseudomonas fluorescens Q2-87]|uniref:Uncharacterized protein n=1 Tax=Pseudomonas fluorescens (strain Q2-87) TaxID=1038922 RepID=J2MSG0_PSEFQ|nr:hypothetical protein PflQ2_5347 [Pseudomonas fluorescens Q2-87]
MGDAGANTLPRQPASQGSNLHASAPAWVFCTKSTLLKGENRDCRTITHCNVACFGISDLFWCVQNRLYRNWLNLEQFPL